VILVGSVAVMPFIAGIFPKMLSTLRVASTSFILRFLLFRAAVTACVPHIHCLVFESLGFFVKFVDWFFLCFCGIKIQIPHCDFGKSSLYSTVLVLAKSLLFLSTENG